MNVVISVESKEERFIGLMKGLSCVIRLVNFSFSSYPYYECRAAL